MSLARDLARQQAAFDRLESVAAAPSDTWAACVPSVSAWSVAQQVEHALRSAVGTLRAALSLAPDGAASAEARATRARPNLPGRAVLLMGRIPRGKGRAPQGMVPGEDPVPALARDLLDQGRRLLADLEGRAAQVGTWSGAFPHPQLGRFSARQWVRFTRIHTEHHLALLDDILRAGT